MEILVYQPLVALASVVELLHEDIRLLFEESRVLQKFSVLEYNMPDFLKVSPHVFQIGMSGEGSLIEI